MSWVKLDDQFSHHPKMIQAGPLAGWLHVCALCYCASYLTDGFIPNGVINVLADFKNIGIDDVDTELVTFGHDIAAPELVDKLLDVGLWERAKNGYLIHDYLKYNPSKAQVLQERAKNAQRQANYQNRHADNLITNADTNADTNASVTGAPSPSPSPTTKSRVGNDKEAAASAAAAAAADLGTAIHSYENAIGTLPGGTVRAEIVATFADLERIQHPEWWQQAIDESVSHNARSWAYMRKILERWIKDGRTSGVPPRRNGSKPQPQPETAEQRRARYIPAGYEELIES